MATLSVWKFEDPAGADQVLGKLEDLQKRQLITVVDAAVVTWEPGAKKPKTRQLHSTTGAGALGGAFWGLLFGLIFFIPLVGVAMGAAVGALTGSMVDVGISDRFIDDVRSKVTPGTSALFLMSADAVVDRIKDELEGIEAELITTNLSAEEEAQLREVFAEE